MARLARLAIFRRKGRVPKDANTKALRKRRLDPRFVYLYRARPDRIQLPRGLWPKVQGLYPALEIEDRRLSLPSVNFRWRGALRPHQVPIVTSGAYGGDGLIVAPPGAGKTVMGLACIAEWQQPAVWLCHTERIWRQAYAEALRRYDLPAGSIGVVGAGFHSPGTHLTVALVQALYRKPAWLTYLGSRVGAVIYDEAHHIAGLTNARVVSAFPAAHRLGLTATPDRGDGLGPMVRAVLGPTESKADLADMVARGLLVLPQVRIRPTPFACRPCEWDVLQRIRAGSLVRNRLICADVNRCWRLGGRIIVLVELIDHARLLAQFLRDRYGVPAFAAVGDTPASVRDRSVSLAESGKIVLVATKLADEGLDAPSLNQLFLAAAGRSQSRIEQQSGRIMRAMAGKVHAVVWDYADLRVPALAGQVRDRMEAYRRMGATVRVAT